MSATVNENLNQHVKGDRVIFNDKESFLYGAEGTVIRSFDLSTEAELDSGTVIITAFTNLKKLTKKKMTKKKKK